MNAPLEIAFNVAEGDRSRYVDCLHGEISKHGPRVLHRGYPRPAFTIRHIRHVSGHGAFFLAEAGLLDGKRATTHWRFARKLRDRFPKVKVDEDRIFIVDGSAWTAAGMSAGLDLALGMIEHDFGAALARSVAQWLLVHHRRVGG